MTVSTLKEKIHKAVDSTEDASLLEKVFAILKKKKTTDNLMPMTMEEFYARNAQAQKDIKEGRVIPHEEVKKMFGYKK